MSAENNVQEQVEAKPVPVVVKQEGKLADLKNTLMNDKVNLLGFDVPYWVLAVALVVAAVMMYRNGVFDNLFNQTMRITDRSVLDTPTIPEGMQTPEVVKRLLKINL